MQARDLRPASELAKRFGVKALVFGGAGGGKSPLIKTAPRPLLLMVETGGLSLRDAVNVPCWEALTAERCDEFFTWFFSSNEAKNYDTLGVDSVSHMAEIYLKQELKRNSHGLKAYGAMATRIMEILNSLNMMPQKHLYLIAKQCITDENGVMKKRPYFTGKQLNVEIPHLFDEVLHIGDYNISGMAKPVQAIRTKETFDVFARDRSGNLDELEQPNLTNLFNKAMK